MALLATTHLHVIASPLSSLTSGVLAPRLQKFQQGYFVKPKAAVVVGKTRTLVCLAKVNPLSETEFSNRKVSLAIPKSKRLSQKVLALLDEIGMNIQWNTPDEGIEKRWGLVVRKLRDDDIPSYVQKYGDCGIVGENVIQEFDVKALLEAFERPLWTDLESQFVFDFGACRMWLQVPESSPIQTLRDLNGLDICTSYPVILEKVLKKEGVSANCLVVSGSVESFVKSGEASACLDIIETGSTMKANKLKELKTVMHSNVVLISNRKHFKENPSKEKTLESFVFFLSGVRNAKGNKLIKFHIDQEQMELVSQILPGLESPSVLSLAQNSYKVSVEVVAHESQVNVALHQLKQMGATNILVLPVQMIWY